MKVLNSIATFVVSATALLFLVLPFAASSAQSAPLKIVSTAAPVHALLVSLTHGAQKPQMLLAPNVLPHGARLTPSQARTLQNADLLVFVGENFAAFESSIKQNESNHIVRLTEIEGITTLPLFEEHPEEKHEEHAEEEHRHAGSVDPHVWLDIENARAIVKLLANLLAERDKPNAALYRTNAGKLDLALRALDREVRATVRGLSGHFLVLHDSTAYFAARYGIRGKESLYAAHHNATRDGMRHTLRVHKKLRSGKYRCVVVQPQLPRKVRKRLLDSDTRVVVIDPLGVSLSQDETFYANLLRSVAEGFRQCLAL